jgi:hypothetical protein
MSFMNRCIPRWAGVSAAIWLASTCWCAGFSMRLPLAFDLDRSVGEAHLIVRGWLDENGGLQPEAFFKGEPPANALSIVEGAKIYQDFRTTLKAATSPPASAVEVVAFLEPKTPTGAWPPVNGCAGLAGLDSTNVYLCEFGQNSLVFDRLDRSARVLP